MKIIFLFIILINDQLFGTSHTGYINTKVPAGKIIIINSFDASQLPARKKKKELFGLLADSLTLILKEKVSQTFATETVVYPGILPKNDSLIVSAMTQYSSTYAIILESMDVYFDQTDVKVEKDKDGKSRTALYDICSYTLIKVVSNKDRKDVDTKDCEYFTERNVMSGLLSAGPDIVGKSKDAYGTLEKNARKFISEVNQKGLIK